PGGAKPGELPLGPLVDDRPAARPQPVVLEGRFGRVEKLASRHCDNLWAVLDGHDAVWAYMSYGPFPDGGAFAAWLATREELADPYSYAILDRSGRAFGIA